MAWKQSYDGRYDLTERVSDEFRFTSGFTRPMVQLDPLYTIVQSSHGSNTFAKKGLIDYFLGKTLDSVYGHLIPATYLTRMTEALDPKEKNPRPPCTVAERCDDESALSSDATGVGTQQWPVSDPLPV